MKKLQPQEIETYLSTVEGWQLIEDKWIQKKYRFKQFLSGIRFVNEVAQIAENRLNHHPFISIEYKLITLRMTTWHAGGLTELDFQAATAFDEAYRQLATE